MDKMIANAKARNMFITATLVNEWGDCEAQVGGKNNRKYLPWFQNGYKQTNDGYALSFRDYSKLVADHYKNESTIAFWQIINEPRAENSDDSCSQSTATTALRNFTDDIVSVMKSVDANHLISLDAGGGQYDCGFKDDGYKTIHSGSIDICEIHDYGNVNEPIPVDTQTRLDQCNSLNKPLIIGEVGINADVNSTGTSTGSVNSTTLQNRANLFENKLKASLNKNIGAFLIWLKRNTCCTNTMDIGPTDPTEKMLAKYVQRFANDVTNTIPPTNTITPTTNPSCLCSNNICSNTCTFTKDSTVTYPNNISCNREIILGNTPTPNEKNLYCNNTKRLIGDADMSGNVDNTDYIYYVRAVNGGVIPANIFPDANGDGVVSATDRAIIVRNIGK